MKIIHRLAIVASLLAAVGSASAQDIVRAVIPFDFKVGKTDLPAGTYTISQPYGAGSNVLVFASNTQKSKETLTIATLNDYSAAEPQLVFTRSSDAYSLNSISTGERQYKISTGAKDEGAVSFNDATTPVVIAAAR